MNTSFFYQIPQIWQEGNENEPFFANLHNDQILQKILQQKGDKIKKG